MRIGSVHIPSPLVLAPMAGVTDLAFRTICRELGAAYTITEMVSAKALCYQDKKTLPLMELGPEEHPGGVQIFGSDLACMEEGAAIIREVAHPDIIDINMGCPVPKVANNGDGSGLLRDLDKACRVAEAVIRGAQGTPVTVKMRLGWDKGNIVCLEARKHYAWYLKGVPYAGYWKSEISKITTLADVYRVTAGIKRELRDGRGDG